MKKDQIMKTKHTPTIPGIALALARTSNALLRKSMNSKRIFASLILTLCVAALIGVVGGHYDVRGVQGDSAHELEGTWEVTVIPNGGDPIVDLATFTDGGGIVNIDPDPNLSAGIGSWKWLGHNSYAVTFIHFLNDHGSPLGKLKVRAEMTLNPDTNTFSGPFRTDVVIGGDVVQSFCGTVQARRVAVEALESCE
jgi:hypothetical protein